MRNVLAHFDSKRYDDEFSNEFLSVCHLPGGKKL
jgi:hypothetical protein